MKKRSRLSMLGAGFAFALAALAGSAQALPLTSAPTTQNETKATAPKVTQRTAHKVHSVGGLDLMQYGNYGMSPKEYGIKFGSGNQKGRCNRLRFSHNAKLKRR
jgi:hypothetical protein